MVGDIGDAKTFERLCYKWRNKPLSFMVILGDFVDTCTRSDDDYFRSECLENVQAFIEIINRYRVDYVISSHYHGYDRMKLKDTVYIVTDGGGAPLDKEDTFGNLYQAVVLTVDHDSISERAILVQNDKAVSIGAKHFAVARLFPLRGRYSAMTIVENLLIIGVFYASLQSLGILRRPRVGDRLWRIITAEQ